MSTSVAFCILVAFIAVACLVSYAAGLSQVNTCTAPVTPAVWHTEAG